MSWRSDKSYISKDPLKREKSLENLLIGRKKRPKAKTKFISLPNNPKYKNDIISFIEENVCLPDDMGNPKPLKLWDFQKKVLTESLRKNLLSSYVHNLILYVAGRGVSKSFMVALVILHRLCTQQNLRILLVSNSMLQARSGVWDHLNILILNSPKILNFIGDNNLLIDSIRLPDYNNLVFIKSGSAISSRGTRADLVSMTEFADSPTTQLFEGLFPSMSAVKNSQMFIDSISSSRLHKLYELYQLSKEDKKVYAWYETNPKVSPLITDDHLNLARKVQPLSYNREYLAEFTSVSEKSLFTPEQIDVCHNNYLLKEPAIMVAGLDRASPWGKGKSKTYFSVLAKVEREDGEHVLVMELENVFLSSEKRIKQLLMRAYEHWGISNAGLEQYQSADLYTWCQENNIPSELHSFTAGSQQSVFNELYYLISEKRFHFDPKYSDLTNQLKNFICDDSGSTPQFGVTGRTGDDAIDSVANGLLAFRSVKNAPQGGEPIIMLGSWGAYPGESSSRKLPSWVSGWENVEQNKDNII